MKKFEKRMKDELNSYTPDLKDKIMSEIRPKNQNQTVKKKTKVKLRYVLSPILTVVIIAIAVVIPLQAVNNGNNGGNDGGGGGSKPPIVNKVTAKEIYTMSAVSSVAYFAADNKGFARTMAEGKRPDDITETVLDNLRTYMGMFESMLVNNGFVYKAEKPTEEKDGEYAKYNIKITSTIEGTEYVLYYNEENAEGEVNADDDDDDITESTTINGELLYDGQVYLIGGHRDVEFEDGEKEITVNFKTYSDKDKGDYVEVTQETEVDEISYKYSIYENHDLKSEREIEWEEEDGKYELSIELEVNKVETEFKIKSVSETEFEIVYKVNEQKHKFKAIKTVNGYDFLFNDEIE